jgi:uncharacterized damage-inducible protein DinB
MNLQDTRHLIAFHYWARNRILDAVDPLTPEQYTRELGGSFGSIRNTLVHMLSAECIWLSRWKGEAPPGMFSPDKFPDVASLRDAWNDQESRMRSFFEPLDEGGIQQTIRYKSILFAGQEVVSPLWQMLQHVVNHATYHRGQITNFLRQLGAAPPKGMDMIVYYRENT